jgi:hypothetical protein
MTIIRKAISKKMRFEIFKRDNFTCQYCSAKPPNIPLEIDHILPVSKGGDNSKDNLITSCFDCNRGKSSNELNTVIPTLIEKTEKIKLAQKQYLQYKSLQKKQAKIINQEISEIENIFKEVFSEYSFQPNFILQVKVFIENIGFYEVKEAMEIACLKISDPNNALKYFCGIYWNKYRNNG